MAIKRTEPGHIKVIDGSLDFLSVAAICRMPFTERNIALLCEVNEHQALSSMKFSLPHIDLKNKRKQKSGLLVKQINKPYVQQTDI